VNDRPSPGIPEYRLRLDVDFDKLGWNGSVEFPFADGGHPVTLDAEDLEVRSVYQDGRSVPFEYDAARHRLTIPRRDAGSSTYRIDFAGRVDPKRLLGLYRCPHGSGHVLTTQCEPIGARLIFPCVDRPDAKAKIHLTVRAPSELEVVSNTPAESVRPQGGATEWTFGPTPPMATYLFYLGIGKFDRVEHEGGRVKVRVLTPPGRGASGQFAVDAGAKILDAYETYYDVPYPLPKLDMIAVAEHAFGAMENWGAISFRDMRLLLEDSSGSEARASVFETICHEIAHQWFGNLVTMAGWGDLWLNESFATLMEAKITERVAPEFDPFTTFVVHTWGMRQGLDGDSLRATHPVRCPVHEAAEIGQTTDAITYGKGASVLRMMDAYLGEETFRSGVANYLRTFRFRNARTEDLWDALGLAARSDVSSVIRPWIDRSGLPVISAELTPGGLHLSQRRFSFQEAPEEAPWPIPLAVDVAGRRERHMFATRDLTIRVPQDATVHLNPGAVGFYRVRYDRALYDRLRRELPRRPALDRWIVLNDLLAFLMEGTVEWSLFETFVRNLGVTQDRVVASELVDSLTALALAAPGGREDALARWYLAELLRLIGTERAAGETESVGMIREDATTSLAWMDPRFAEKMGSRFPEWDRVDPDLRRAVAIGRARTGGAVGYHELRAALDRSPGESDSLRYGLGLAWSADPALVAEMLDLARTGRLNRGHIYILVAHAAMNPTGRPLVGPWLEERLPELSQIYRGSAILSYLLELTLPFSGLGRLEETRAFFREHPFPDAARGIAKGLERLEVVERYRSRTAT
jgi:tricorn protease interacting factor F2/3